MTCLLFQIDESTLPLLTEEELTTYLPSKGDRIAARQFCTKRGEKQSLLDRLRRRFTDGDAGENRHTRAIKLKGNANASKPTKIVEVGWLNFCNSKNSYVQVRSQCGGGTRLVSFDKQDTAKYVLEKGKSLFFPSGQSKKGPSSNFQFEVCDFQEKPVAETSTISELYNSSQMKSLRLYIGTKRIEHETEMPPIKRIKRKRPRQYSTREITNNPPIPMQSHDFLSLQSQLNYVPTTNAEESGIIGPQNLDLLSQQTISSVSQSLNMNYETNSFHYRDTDVSFHVPVASYEEAVNAAVHIPIDVSLAGVSQGNTLAVASHIIDPIMSAYPNLSAITNNSLPASSIPYRQVGFPILAEPEVQGIQVSTIGQSTNSVEIEMNIHRGTLSFRECIGYFKDGSIMDKSLKIKRILPNGEVEMAEDSGGVLRDLLTEFWKSFYEIATMGREAKVPTIRHDFSAIEWEAVGRVLVYGYKRTSYWPVMLAKTFITQCLVQEEEPKNDSLLNDFYSYVSRQDMNIFKQAFDDYAAVDKDDLLESLDIYECKTAPNSDNIKPIILEIAHAVIIQKPKYISTSMKSVMKDLNLSEESIDGIYRKLIPSNKAVLKIIKFPDNIDAQELETSQHLKRYIRDFDDDKLRVFLRYCTGSDLLTMEEISVEFSVMGRFERCPFAHTCSCMLQLSKTYESYMDFRSEFDNILSSNVWVMDGI